MSMGQVGGSHHRHALMMTSHSVTILATHNYGRTDLMNFGRLLPRRGVIFVSMTMLVVAISGAVAQGTISGRVTAQGSGDPLPESRVAVVGTNLVGSTAAD